MGDETISLSEWVEAIQDVASLEKKLRGPLHPQKQQILLQARKEAVERVLAMRLLTGATTDRVEAILNTEPWATEFYEDLSKEGEEDDMGQPRTQRRQHRSETGETGKLPSWYQKASPFGKSR